MSIEKERKILVPHRGDDKPAFIPVDAAETNIQQRYIKTHDIQVDLRPDAAGRMVFYMQDTYQRNQGKNVELIIPATNHDAQAMAAEMAHSTAVLFNSQSGPNVERPLLNAETGEMTLTSDMEIRVRIKEKNSQRTAYLTIKTPTSEVDTRNEFEFQIPTEIAEDIMETRTMVAGRLVTKTRYTWQQGEDTIEADVFRGANDGLVMVEVENPSANIDLGFLPAGSCDVTADKRYSNKSLSSHPYGDWSDKSLSTACAEAAKQARAKAVERKA